MNIRLADYNDLDAIKALFVCAKETMNQDGNHSQWQDIDYPFCYTKNDIDKKQCFIVTNDKDEIVATFVFIIGDDPTYSYIEGGRWINNNKYGTIHRLASNHKEKNIFNEVMEYVSSYKVDIRVDTHKDNKRMIHLIEKNGFKYCGIIYVLDGTPRLAYQKAYNN